jgi:hypothetical protein
MRWVDYVASIRDKRDTNKILVNETEEKDHLEDLGVDGRIILKLILKK